MNYRLVALFVPMVAFLGCGDDDTSSDAGTGAATSGATATGSEGGSTGAPSAGATDDDGSSGAPATDDAADSSSDGGSTGEGGSETTAGAGPTWSNFGEAFFESYCWECHGAGDAMRDYTLLETVMSEAARIRCGTASAAAPADNCDGLPPAAQFPIGANLPTDEERATLVAWIDAGLPE